MSELNGKVALVTGGARGIGREVARLFAERGARVVISDIDLAGVDGSHGRAVAHDVTSEQDWARVIRAIETEEKRLDVLVNNAGVILNRPFLQTTLEEFRQVQRINVESVWLGMQAAASLMTSTARDSVGGSIINMSSIYGQVAGPAQAAYCASKGAVRLLTKAAAVEFARSGSKLRVNSVHPGPIDTDLGNSGLRDAVTMGRLPDIERGRAMIAAAFPMGRWGQVDDVAGAVLFLASDASKFMTGSELVVDGGYSIL